MSTQVPMDTQARTTGNQFSAGKLLAVRLASTVGTEAVTVAGADASDPGAEGAGLVSHSACTARYRSQS